MNTLNYGNIYDYQTGEYLREAERHELRRTLVRLDESDAGAWEDPKTGRYVYVSDEDTDAHWLVLQSIAANKEAI